MTYSAVYCALIESRKQSPLSEDQYSEEHHIVPKSEGGSDDKSNLVRLSAREHYIAHLLLAKIYDDYAMYSALTYMQCKSSNHQRDFKFNSRLYAKMREQFAKKFSENHPSKKEGYVNPRKGKHHTAETKKLLSQIGKTKTGKDNSFYGHHHSEQTRRKLSKARKGKSSWKKGLSTEECLAHMTKEEYESMKKKCSESMKGKKFWNNGIKSVRAYECPPGFISGRLSKKKS